ncbi:DUF2778 domain-containing protein [Bradyrhizobium lablabi]|uniref:DUF2778 domain-containing protein n=1 Tax=Bradyrhizobium lablabi TaxID=722472 RepID=UPI001BABD993|nr:DUF2778 domain-containing protein [Bradyrhizobium lablabi]MBR1122481.1 DUF2778 domain-containing protein [Bradyrhizobium lablabi]
MRQGRARADERSPRGRGSRAGTIALACTALVLGVGAAAWMTDPAATALLSANAPANSFASFNERFLPPPPAESLAPHYASSVLDRAAVAAADIRAMQARAMLAQQLQSQDWQSTVDEEPEVASAPSVPMPRARPAEANLTSRSVAFASASSAPQGEERSMLQKFSDLLPGRITLASLAPNGGLFRRGPDLGSLGYDSFTAVYDISARAVYLPDGTTLEAHSGLGDKMDKIEYVGQRMVGVTPPGAYALKPREKLFHGVKALRLTPADTENALGRTGLLVHNYLLGPDGGSNGCVSIRDYERFLKAYEDGQIMRLVVVVSLSDSITASRRGASPS